MGTISHIAPNIADKTIILHLMDALDDAEQLCEDYNASPQVSAGITSLYHVLDAMRCSGDCAELGDVLREAVLAATYAAGIREDSIARIEAKLA